VKPTPAQPSEAPAYGIHRITGLSFDTALERISEALKEEGFGVLTQIDVRQTLKDKIGVDFPRFVILGACNPRFAHEALTADHRIGLLLPCNVVVQEVPGGSAMISAIRPTVLFERLAVDPKIVGVAKDAEERLGRAIEKAALTQ